MVMDTTVGRPADILEGLALRGVRVEAGCLFPRTEGRVAHLTVDDADEDAVRAVALEHGALVLDAREVLVIDPDRHGGAASVARRVADAGATVQVSYYGAEGQIVLATSDLALARQALGIDGPDTVSSAEAPTTT